MTRRPCGKPSWLVHDKANMSSGLGQCAAAISTGTVRAYIMRSSVRGTEASGHALADRDTKREDLELSICLFIESLASDFASPASKCRRPSKGHHNHQMRFTCA